MARELFPDALAVFDFAEPGFVSGARETTNVPAQALFLLNSPFIATAAQKLAQRLLAAYPGDTHFDERIQLACWLVFSRAPTETERKTALTFFSKFPAPAPATEVRTISTGSSPDPSTAAWTSFSRVLFASAEFRFLN